jgi:hypothetical protein
MLDFLVDFLKCNLCLLSNLLLKDSIHVLSLLVCHVLTRCQSLFHRAMLLSLREALFTE